MTGLERHLTRCQKRSDFCKELEHKITRQGAFDAHCLHLGHPAPGGGRVLEASDHGASAERIRAVFPERLELWQKLWLREVRALPPMGRRVLAALLQDWRTAPAAKIARVSRPTVDSWKFKLRKPLRPVYNAWCSKQK